MAEAIAGRVLAHPFAYQEHRAVLSGAPQLTDDRGCRFTPVDLQITVGRPGPTGRPDLGTEVDVAGPDVLRPKSARRQREWSSTGSGDWAMESAPTWVPALAQQVVDHSPDAGPLADGPIQVASIDHAQISGTEWRIELADAPATAGRGRGDFLPTVMLVLHSNIASRGRDLSTSIVLVGTALPGHPLSGLGTRWDSQARNSAYSFASAPAWVLALAVEHAGLPLAGAQPQ